MAEELSIYQTLNQVMNNIQINHPKRLGFSLVALSRKSSPVCLSDWRDAVNEALEKHGWSFDKLSQNLSLSSNIPVASCKQYLENLFIDKTYGAFERERSIYNEIEKYYTVRWATVLEEFTYAIDLVVENTIGIQVKPQSYDNAIIDVHKKTIENNKMKNSKWGGKIIYVYYRGRSVFMDTLLEELKSSLPHTKSFHPPGQNSLDAWM